jgi:hypothetical protein
VRATRSALVGATSFYTAYFLSGVIPTPLLWYLPLSGSFVFSTVVTELGMDFYGRLLLSLLVGGATALLAQPWRTAPHRILAALMLTSLGLCLALELTVLSQRQPVPLLQPMRATP